MLSGAISLLCTPAVTFSCTWVSFECICNLEVHFSTLTQNKIHKESNTKQRFYKTSYSANFTCASTRDVPTSAGEPFQRKLSGKSLCLYIAAIPHPNFHLFLDLMKWLRVLLEQGPKDISFALLLCFS